MACYHPLQAYLHRDYMRSGIKRPTFNINDAYAYGVPRLPLPCGQCIGCRLERVGHWATRIVHESKLYEDNCFITLTYDTDKVQRYNLDPLSLLSLQKKHFQDFMKRLRFMVFDRICREVCGYRVSLRPDGKRVCQGFCDSVQSKNRVRFFSCGEYGELNSRPHFHAIIFNYDFKDKKRFKRSPSGYDVYVSNDLESLWPYGYSSVASVSFQSAAYVARYVTKKVSGKLSQSYCFCDISTGECISKTPEYAIMSRRPGIAKAWYDKYKFDVYNYDLVVIDDGSSVKKLRPPPYYDRLYKAENPTRFKELRDKRECQAARGMSDRTAERLIVREKKRQIEMQRILSYRGLRVED